MILREIKMRSGVAFKPPSFCGFEKIIQTTRKALGMPSHFTLDACRHGGMTELEEAALPPCKCGHEMKIARIDRAKDNNAKIKVYECQACRNELRPTVWDSATA